MPASVGGIRAGRAFILIEAVDATGKVTAAIGRNLKSWGRSLMMIGTDMAFKAAMGLTGVGAAVKVYSDFDDAMRRVEARSEGTAEQLAALRAEARELGKTTALSAIDVANLAAELAAMGFTRSQMLQMVRPITMLAQAGGTGNKSLDAINAAKLVSGTLRSYQMDFAEASKVADVMAQALNLSNAALEDMATSMAYAGPIANRYKVSLEDTVSVLGHLRNLNIDAETAGTAFRNMLLEMTDPKGRDKFNKLLDEMTGKTINFVDEAGNLKSVTDLLFAIGDISKGLGTAQQGQLFFELFGKRAIVPASALAEGKNAFEGIRMQMEDVTGTATRMANIMESGLGGSWRRFKGALIDVAIVFGEALTPMLQSTSKLFRDWLASVGDFISRNRGLINSVIAGVAAFGLLGATLFIAGYGVSFLGSTLVLLGTVLGAVAMLFSPLSLVVAELTLIAYLNRENIFGLLSSGARDLSSALGFTRDAVDDLKRGFREAGETIGDTLTYAAEALKRGDIKAAFDILTAGMKVSWLEMVDGLLDAWDRFAGTFESATMALSTTFQTLQLGIKQLVVKLYDAEIATRNFLKSFLVEGHPGRKKIEHAVSKLKEQRDQMALELDKELSDIEKAPKALEKRDKAREQAALKRQIDLENERAKLFKMIEDLEAAGNIPPIPMSGPTPIEEYMTRAAASRGIPDDIIGVGAGSSGLSPKIHDALQRGSAEAAKQAYESYARVAMADQVSVERATLEEAKKHTSLLDTMSKDIKNFEEILAPLTE